ncbi:MAG: acyl-CoA reductase [Flavobacteriales bacterium]
MNETIQQSVRSAAQLGRVLKALSEKAPWPGFSIGLDEAEYQHAVNELQRASLVNAWFTPDSIAKALGQWAELMQEETLIAWLESEDARPMNSMRVGIIAAGNIPMVAWHDILSAVLLQAHVTVKLSSDDPVLIPMIMNIWKKFDDAISFQWLEGKLEKQDAVIATGSNNTSRYFDYYFRDTPHIIRKSRTSVAVLNGTESSEDLRALGHDVFDYFGMGCRSVSKIFMPIDFEINRFIEAIFDFNPIVNHHKYANNYDYHKAVWLLNREELLDNGFLMFKECADLHAPTGSVFYSRYSSLEEVRDWLGENQEQVQCVIGSDYLPFGSSQRPGLTDYADHVNVIQFLMESGRVVA